MAVPTSCLVIAAILITCFCGSNAEYCRISWDTWSYCSKGCCDGGFRYYVCCNDDDHPKEETSSSTGLIVGAVLASVAGLFVMVAVVGAICCCCAASNKTPRGRAGRVVHPTTGPYDGATLHVFYTAGSGGYYPYQQPLVPGAQPIQPPAYKQEPDPGPPTYSSLGQYPRGTCPAVREPDGRRPEERSRNGQEGPRTTPSAPETLRVVVSPPPPYFDVPGPSVSSGAVAGGAAPRSTMFPQ